MILGAAPSDWSISDNSSYLTLAVQLSALESTLLAMELQEFGIVCMRHRLTVQRPHRYTLRLISLFQDVPDEVEKGELTCK